ncbi:MAG TPA: hypothetical protein VLJ39_11085, partial [Tepidisphaeraceae bacterium]|nr:hypothetical protein [Tepidisphaeraceae bacterium]
MRNGFATKTSQSLCILFLAFARAANAQAPARSENLHDAIVSEYLDGKWDVAESRLPDVARSNPPLSRQELADVDYVRKTLAECRPGWWKLCKAGKKVSFRTAVWGQSQGFTYDPAGKTNLQINVVNGAAAIT